MLLTTVHPVLQNTDPMLTHKDIYMYTIETY